MFPRRRPPSGSTLPPRTSTGAVANPGLSYGPKSPTSPTSKTSDVFNGTGRHSNDSSGRPVKKSDSFTHSRNKFAQSERESKTVSRPEPNINTRSSVSSEDGDKNKVKKSELVTLGRKSSVANESERNGGVRRGSSASSSSESSSTVASGLSAPPVQAATVLGNTAEVKFTSPEQPGFVGFANLPNQVHRKSVKKGFEFTLMVVGESGLGKSTLVNSLFLTDLYPERHIHSAAEKIKQTVKIDASTVEIEERGVKLRLTVVDTPGFGDSLNSGDCFKPIIQYVDDQFERYLQDESGLNRRHIVDNRVHCCFYFINPSGHGLRPLDISFMKAVHNKVNIVPVIAKADTLTRQEVTSLKQRIMNQIKEQGISLYPLPDCDDDEDEDYREQCRLLKEAVPFAVIGANTVIEVKGRKVRGRMYPWGVVEVENPEHCDFIKLRTMLITHMQDLQEVTQEVHYENFRAEKLADGGSVPKKTRKVRSEEQYTDKRRPESQAQELTDREKQLMEKEQELRKMQEQLAKMQAEMDQQKRNTPTKMQHNGGFKSQDV